MNKPLLLLLFFSVNLLCAQDPELGDLSTEEKISPIIQPNRIEFEIEDKDGDYTVIPADDRGLLVIADTRNNTREGYMWKFNMVDTSLNLVWQKEYPIPHGANFKGYDHSLGNVFMMFETSSYKREEMLLFQLDIESGDTTTHEFSTVFPIDLTFFEVVDRTILVGGFANNRPVVLLYNIDEDKPRVLPGFYTDDSEILEIITDDLTKTFTVVKSEKLTNRTYTIASNTYDYLGNELQDSKLIPEEDKSLLDGVSTTFENGQQYIAGTYARRKSEYSRGLYLANIAFGQQKVVQYHNYADLENFFGYMRDKREERIKKRIERRKDSNKKNRFNYRVLVHEIIDRGDESILVGEAYYPMYSSTAVHSPGMAGAGMPLFRGNNNWFNPGFQGYKYTHAIVVSFDKSGKIRWDNSFEINDVETYNLKEYVHVSAEDDKVVLLYLYEGEIRSKIIQGNEVLEGKSFDPVKLSFENDIVKSSNKYHEGLETWHDQAFYAYGVQKIRNMKDKNIKLNREIFYINKIVYQ